MLWPSCSLTASCTPTVPHLQATLATSNEAVFEQLVSFARERHQELRPSQGVRRNGPGWLSSSFCTHWQGE